MDRGVILTHGFRIQLAKNGGVMVFQYDLYMEPEAVFTDTASFLTWIADQIEGLKAPPEPGEDPLVGRIYQHANPPCGYGCNDQVVATNCPIHGGSNA